MHDLCSHALPGDSQFLAVGVFGTMALLSWLRPLIMYVGDQSEAVHLDEGVLVVLLLLVRPCFTVLTFALVSHDRGPGVHAPAPQEIRVQFRAGARFSGSGHQPPDVEAAAAALVGMPFCHQHGGGDPSRSATGMTWKKAVLDGLDMRLVINVCGVALGVAAALFVSAYPDALPLAVFSLATLRYTLGGFFRARHDRARLEGLFLGLPSKPTVPWARTSRLSWASCSARLAHYCAVARSACVQNPVPTKRHAPRSRSWVRNCG